MELTTKRIFGSTGSRSPIPTTWPAPGALMNSTSPVRRSREQPMFWRFRFFLQQIQIWRSRLSIGILRHRIRTWDFGGLWTSPPADRSRCVIRQSFRRSEEHTSELQSPCNLVCRLLLEKKKKRAYTTILLRNEN